MKKGFTLLEILVVIIIVGILATIGFTQYAAVMERGRTVEAKAILGTIRTMQQAYYEEYNEYAATKAILGDTLFPSCSASKLHYFSYDTSATAAVATRCSSTATSKAPSHAGYAVTLTYSTGTIASGF